MKIFGFLAIVLFLLAACSGGSAVDKQLAASDSRVINFNEPQTNNIEKTMTTTESKAIKKLAGYVDGKKAEEYKCGYDGNLLFYKKGVVLGDVAFNYSEDSCRHFIQSVDGKLMSSNMRKEAAAFLQSLAEGKGWY